MSGVHEPIPSRYGNAIGIMRYMGWSLDEFWSADAVLVDEIAERIAAEDKWTDERDRRDHKGK